MARTSQTKATDNRDNHKEHGSGVRTRPGADAAAGSKTIATRSEQYLIAARPPLFGSAWSSPQSPDPAAMAQGLAERLADLSDVEIIEQIGPRRVPDGEPGN